MGNKTFCNISIVLCAPHLGMFITEEAPDSAEADEEDCVPAINLPLEMMCAAICVSTDKCLGFVFHEEAKQCYLKTLDDEQEQSGNCEQQAGSRWSKRT